MKGNKAALVQATLAAAVALLVVPTAHCHEHCAINATSDCSTRKPSDCSNRTPVHFMEHYRELTGPVDISVRIDDLRQAENTPTTFDSCNSAAGFSRVSSPCNKNVCNSTCGNRPPKTPNSTCPWNYECDYDPQRIPQYLYHAVCEDHGMATLYSIPVLRTEQPSCDPLNSTTTTWKWEMQLLSVACVCDQNEES